MITDRGSFLSPSGRRILAHRGLAVSAPENTLLAFGEALANGATHVETDVRCTRDGVAVICHDPALPDGRPVNRVTMAQLSRIDLGQGQAYCSLAEALATFPLARFNIDVKSRDAVLPAARAVRDSGAERRVLITSFSDRRRRQTLRSVPGTATSASMPGIALMLAAVMLRQTWLLPRILRAVDAIQVPEQVGPLRIVTPRVIGLLHALGVEVHVWTVNDPARMRALFAWDVDGIVTDRCDLAAGALRAASGDGAPTGS